MGYIDLKYEPSDSDIVCKFYVEPAQTLEHAAENIAAESSIGTWTDLTTMKPRIAKQLQAHVFKIDKKRKIIDVAYPLADFEINNIPQMLSSFAGNIFGMRAVNSLRLLDFSIPKEIQTVFMGPAFGIEGIRKLLKVKDRPLVGTIVKPKIGLNPKEHAKVAYEAWVGGCDIVKDDENLTNQDFNPFEERVEETLAMLEKAEKETGEKKVYMANVTADAATMIERAEFVKEEGGTYAMVDIITTGFSALQVFREQDLGLVLHAHRAMHAALTRMPTHGISMLCISKLMRLIGFDQLHIGTVVGKMSEDKETVLKSADALRKQEIEEREDVVKQSWMKRMRPVFPVASGGLHPGHVDALVDILGKDVIIQMGGGIHGHTKGTRAGAKAARQAIDAKMKKIPAKEYAKTHKELAEALKLWSS